MSVNQVPNLAPNSFSVVKSKITGLVERFGWASGEGTVEYLGHGFTPDDLIPFSNCVKDIF